MNENQRWERTTGDKFIHLYDYTPPRHYPIRVCNWEIPSSYPMDNGEARKCKLCEAYLLGKHQVSFAPKVTP